MKIAVIDHNSSNLYIQEIDLDLIQDEDGDICEYLIAQEFNLIFNIKLKASEISWGEITNIIL